MSLERGVLLNGRYRIVDILGQGGMGAVYRAIDEHLDLEVAVKENLFLTEEFSRQFRREASILAGLRQANLPRVSDYFAISGQGQYLVMDYIEGEDLRQRMERTGTISEVDAMRVGTAVCDALTYLHTRKPAVIHRDVKPGNVRITSEGEIFLVDFGLAKLMQDLQATTTGARAMTPGYSPPEQYGTARTSVRTDIYSLAATLYAALTGTIPEDGLARITGTAELTPMHALNPQINPKLAVVIEKGLELEPDRRFQTADEFKAALIEASTTPRRDRSNALGMVIPTKEDPEKPKEIVPVSHPGFVRRQISPARPLSPTRGKSAWMALVVFVLLAGSGAILFSRPFLFRPGTSMTSTPAASKNESPTAAAISLLATSSLSPTPSPTPTSAPPTSTPTATVTATPQSTPVGGGQGLVAFVSNRTGSNQIWLMDPNGGNLKQLTNLPDGACQPNWSPDGKRLALVSPCPGRREVYEGSSIFLIDVNGANLVPLPASPEGDFDPAWAPDGKRIAFTSLRTGRPQIFVYNLLDQSVKNVSDLNFSDVQPSWNPSGSQIAFTRYRVYAQIWFMSDTGQRPTQYSRSGEFNDRNSFWSPDGQIIFYAQSSPGSDVPWLMAMRYEERGSNKENRIPANSQNFAGPVSNASVSPDGQWLVFESWPDGKNHDIYRMTINGADPQRLTTDRDMDFQPAWQPSKK